MTCRVSSSLLDHHGSNNSVSIHYQEKAVDTDQYWESISNEILQANNKGLEIQKFNFIPH